MFRKISSWLNGDDKLVSLHLHILDEDNAQVKVLYLDLISGYTKILKEFTFLISDIDSINDWPTRKALLIVTGKGVVSRKSSQENIEIEKKFLELYPTSNPSDFYISEYLSGENSSISFIRKDKLTHLLDVIDQKVKIVDINIGYLSILNSYEIVLLKNTFEFQFQEGIVDKREPLILRSTRTTDYLEFNGEKLSIVYIEAYFSALNYIMRASSYNSYGFKTKAERLKLEYHFSRFMILTAIVLFLLLIINTIVFYSYNDKYNNLQSNQEKNGDHYAEVLQLKNRIEQKRNIISEVGLNNDINIALLIQTISKNVPDNILFKSIEVFPNDILNSKDKMVFNNHKVVITGESKDIVDVHLWIQELNTSKKMKSNLESYTKKNSNERSQFKVVVNI